MTAERLFAARAGAGTDDEAFHEINQRQKRITRYVKQPLLMVSTRS